MAIDDKVRDYFLKLKEIEGKKEELEKSKENIENEKDKLEKEYRELCKGKFSDSLLEYCFLRYGNDAIKQMPLVKRFASELEKNAGQKLLVFNEGGKGTSTALGVGVRDIPYEIIIGRLKKPCFEFRERTNFVAVVENQKRFLEFGFTHASNAFTEDNSKIGLDEFIDSYGHIDYRDGKGFQAVIPVPLHREPTIGGHMTYNSDIISRFIVGDKRVDDYLGTLDLNVISKSKAKIPAI